MTIQSNQANTSNQPRDNDGKFKDGSTSGKVNPTETTAKTAAADTMAKNGNPGNFANDPEKASEAGRKGGQSSTSSHK